MDERENEWMKKSINKVAILVLTGLSLNPNLQYYVD